MRPVVYALATGAGRSALAVVRCTGAKAGLILDSLCSPRPEPRRASVRSLRDATGEVLDQAVVLWFPGPGSYTGEDLFELHIHGGGAVSASVLHRLADLGCRAAEPGEFTRRAFEAGRVTLSQAEAVADLVDAETQAQQRQALAHLGGLLERRLETWRSRLIGALAHLEGAIDFPDEDLPPEVAAQARGHLQSLRKDFAAALTDARGEAVRAGFRVVIVGLPNAGKSTLFNALVGGDAAIVTARPGTTRDVLERDLVLAGFKVHLSDTAGLRLTDDEVEAEGVRRAVAAAEAADLRIFVIPGGQAGREDLLVTPREGDLGVASKMDLFATSADASWSYGTLIQTSADDPATFAALRVEIEHRVRARLGGAEPPALVRARHREVMTEAVGHLDRALAADPSHAELAAEDVRLVARALERLTGRIGAEDVLDRVFSTFCIGK